MPTLPQQEWNPPKSIHRRALESLDHRSWQPRRTEWFNPRKVDMALFNDEESARKRWHETQSAAEQWED